MAVCSILYQLATRPEQQEKMYQELKRIMPDPNTPLNTKLLDQMEFLKAFVKEVLRYLFIKNCFPIFEILLGFILRSSETEELYNKTR